MEISYTMKYNHNNEIEITRPLIALVKRKKKSEYE